MATLTESTPDIQTEIRKMNDLFESMYAQGNAAALASLYTEHGMLLPPGSEVIRSREGIQNFWQAVMNMGIKQARLVSVVVEQLGDTAIEQGQYVLSGATGQTLDEGKYLVIWKRKQGQWKLDQDIWNTSLRT
jgi:uncharacterized protein (TIGR02246 family)